MDPHQSGDRPYGAPPPQGGQPAQGAAPYAPPGYAQGQPPPQGVPYGQEQPPPAGGQFASPTDVATSGGLLDKVLRQITLGQPTVDVTTAFGYFTKFAKVAAAANYFGYRYVDFATPSFGRSPRLTMTLDPDPAVRQRGQEALARFHQGGMRAVVAGPPAIAPPPLKLLIARLVTDAGTKHTLPMMGLIFGVIMLTNLLRLSSGDEFALVNMIVITVAFGVGLTVTLMRISNARKRLVGAGYQSLSDHAGRRRHFPPGEAPYSSGVGPYPQGGQQAYAGAQYPQGDPYPQGGGFPQQQPYPPQDGGFPQQQQQPPQQPPHFG